MSLAYLVVDFFPQVESIEAILTTPAFWMLWAVFAFLNSIAFSLLYVRSFNKVEALIEAPHLSTAAIQLLSTVAVYSILQSFTLQFAGHKVVDVEQMVTRFRSVALRAAVVRRANLTRETARNLAGRMLELYRHDAQALTEDYAQIMNLARLKPDRIRQDLQSYLASAGLERETFVTEMVLRMALTDDDGARRLLARRRIRAAASQTR